MGFLVRVGLDLVGKSHGADRARVWVIHHVLDVGGNGGERPLHIAPIHWTCLKE